MKTRWWAALMVAVPMPAAAQASDPVVPMVPASGTVLDVSAEGRTTRVPDVAAIRAGVVTQASGAGAALSANAQRMAAVLEALRRAGIASRDLQSANVSLSPQYRYEEGRPPAITGYEATNSVSIRFRDVARAGPILDTLVAQGANQIDGPNLGIDAPDAALDEARANAVKAAQARAELYARAAGLRVERIISISEIGQDSGDAPRPPMYMRVAAAAPAPTQIELGEREVTARLQVRFLLR